jgi:hypothetical protein
MLLNWYKLSVWNKLACNLFKDTVALLTLPNSASWQTLGSSSAEIWYAVKGTLRGLFSSAAPDGRQKRERERETKSN